MSLNHQLLAVDCRTGRRSDPWQGLLGKARHLVALRAEEVDVVAGAVPGSLRAMHTEPPGSVSALDSVQQTGRLKSAEGPVDRYPVKGPVTLQLPQDLRMRERE